MTEFISEIGELFLNGQIWESPSHLRAVLQVLPGSQFCLLAYTACGAYGRPVLSIVTNKDGQWMFPMDEFEERLGSWVLTTKVLRME